MKYKPWGKINMKPSRKLIAITAVTLSAVITIAATFAWFVAQDSKKNHFETGQGIDGTVNIVETFDPPTDWVPGQEILKNVSAVNNGQSDAFVRISFEEVLKKLPNNGQMQTSTSAPAAGSIPVHVNNAAFSSANGWSAVPAGDLSASLPSNVHVLRKSVSAPGGKTVDSFVIYYEPAPGDTQKMTADFAWTGTAPNKKLDVTNIQYYYYNAKVTTEADWAGKNVYVTQGTQVTPPQTVAPNLPTNLVADNLIHIKYGQVSATINTGDWWYNPADGYFYFIGKLAPGQTAPLLLDTITLDPTCGNEYALMELDLHVLLEGIQNTEAALAGAWSVTTGPLYNALKPFCAV